MVADAADIRLRGSERDTEGTSWQTIGSVSSRVVAGLTARLGGVVPAGKNCPSVSGGDETLGLFGDAGQAIAEEKTGGRALLRSTAGKVPPRGIGGGAAGEHVQNHSPRLSGAPMLSK